MFENKALLRIAIVDDFNCYVFQYRHALSLLDSLPAVGWWKNPLSFLQLRISFQKEIEEVTADIIEDVLKEIIVYPDHTLNIIWNYQDDLKKLILDIGMGGQTGKPTD